MSCKSKTYCPYPFIGVSLQSDGITPPCGQYSNIAPFNPMQSIEEARNSKHMQEMRERMLNNQHDSGCQCPAEEAAGIQSMRQAALDKFGYNPFGPIKTVEIFFDNVCNLKCRMCASPYSHLLFEEEKELYGESISKTKYVKNTKYQDVDFSALEEVEVYGGEPLLSQDANKFFDKLTKEGNIYNIDVKVSTNGTVLPMEHVLHAFKNCKILHINISIDGYNKLNEYIRKGSDWNNCVSTMKFFDTLIDERGDKQTNIQVHSAIGIYNANLINELDNFVLENFPRFGRTKQMIQYPVWLNIQNSPADYKKLIEDTVDKDTYNFMYNKSEDYFSHFINFHNKMDSMRKESIEHINPVLHQYIKSYIPKVDNSKAFFIEKIRILQGAK